VARICSAHHVLGIKHLLSELRHGEGAVLLRASGSEWCEASHVKVQPREWHQVHSHLTEVTVELSRETKTTGGAGKSCGDQVVQISVSWSGKFQSAETYVIEGLIVKEVAGVGVLHKLVEAQHSIVWLNDSVLSMACKRMLVLLR